MLLSVDATILVLTGLVIFAYFFKSYVRSNRRLPPGPMGLPLIGYIPFMRKDPHIKLTQLQEKYGDVYSLKLGFKYVVVLNSEETFREAGSSAEVYGRPKQSDFIVAPLESPLFANGKVWSEHRRFVFKVFRELEAGSAMEENMKHEISCLVDLIGEQRGKPVFPRPYLESSVANYITRLCFGVRYNIDDPEREILKCCLDESLKLITTSAVGAYIPWLNRISIVRKILQTERLVEIYREFCSFTGRRIKEHREALAQGAPKDFLDYYLVELNSEEKKQCTTFSESLINDTLAILYVTGSETVSTTLRWCLYVMATYPDVQEKVQKEIDDIVGRDRMPSLSDQKNLPYTQAVIMEIHRWRTVVPIIGKLALVDCCIGGYHVPKGTLLLLNSWAVHHDPRRWKNPDDFIPERFLSADGKLLLTDNKNYMPFGVGKRSCPGEKIGIIEVFLFFTTILQNFKLKFPEGHTADLSCTMTCEIMPKEQEVRFIRRRDYLWQQRMLRRQY